MDVACGSGYGSAYLKKKGASYVVGDDISQDAIDYASAHYAEDNLTFSQLEATDLPFPDASFDIMVSIETIEHVPDYRKFLSECKRVLKSPGKLILSTPNKSFALSLNREAMSNYHIREFFADDLRTLDSDFFNELSLYCQIRSGSNPGAGEKSLKNGGIRKFYHWGGIILSLTPLGDRIRKAISRLIRKRNTKRSKIGINIPDDLLDKRYGIVPYDKADSIPASILVIAIKH